MEGGAQQSNNNPNGDPNAGGNYNPNDQGGNYNPNDQGGNYIPNDQGGNYPQDGGNYPQDGGNYPQDGGNYPQQGGNYPQQGGNYPQQGGYYNNQGYGNEHMYHEQHMHHMHQMHHNNGMVGAPIHAYGGGMSWNPIERSRFAALPEEWQYHADDMQKETPKVVLTGCASLVLAWWTCWGVWGYCCLCPPLFTMGYEMSMLKSKEDVDMQVARFRRIRIWAITTVAIGLIMVPYALYEFEWHVRHIWYSEGDVRMFVKDDIKWKAWSNKQYKVFPLVHRTWEDAQNFCKNTGNGGQLAILNSATLTTEMRKHLVNGVLTEKENSDCLGRFWIGLTDVGTTNNTVEFGWDYGARTPLTQSDYNLWNTAASQSWSWDSASMPDAENTCVSLGSPNTRDTCGDKWKGRSENVELSWRNENCIDTKNAFICERLAQDEDEPEIYAGLNYNQSHYLGIHTYDSDDVYHSGIEWWFWFVVHYLWRDMSNDISTTYGGNVFVGDKETTMKIRITDHIEWASVVLENGPDKPKHTDYRWYMDDWCFGSNGKHQEYKDGWWFQYDAEEEVHKGDQMTVVKCFDDNDWNSYQEHYFWAPRYKFRYNREKMTFSPKHNEDGDRAVVFGVGSWLESAMRWGDSSPSVFFNDESNSFKNKTEDGGKDDESGYEVHSKTLQFPEGQSIREHMDWWYAEQTLIAFGVMVYAVSAAILYALVAKDYFDSFIEVCDITMSQPSPRQMLRDRGGPPMESLYRGAYEGGAPGPGNENYVSNSGPVDGAPSSGGQGNIDLKHGNYPERM